MEEHSWLKNRGYLHITNSLNIPKDRDKLISMVTNPKFVSKHAFFPLIHAVINERRYKIIDEDGNRGHKFIDEDGKTKQTIKHRPLHYAAHMDALIFGYYAFELQRKYEDYLRQQPLLSDSITAYRKIPILNSDKNKSTIHFAKDVFDEIGRRTEGCMVLKFDIKSFFSRLDHVLIKKSWSDILGVDQLPPDHYNVFRAVTNFSYILKDELRLPYSIGKRRSGFDEQKLAQHRKKGIISFYESPKEFRDALKEKSIRIYKHPFRNSTGEPVGIPQGLPISAVLANLYLLEFDKKIINNLVEKLGSFYRRYSDDIIIVCKDTELEIVKNFVFETIVESKVEMSKEKTEVFRFQYTRKAGHESLTPSKFSKDSFIHGIPFAYLGFEFYGNKTLVKSANLAKFYRRMIRSIRSRAQRALAISLQRPGAPLIIYRRQLYKIYTLLPLDSTKVYHKRKILVKNARGEFEFRTKSKTARFNTTYLSYIKRASEAMNEPAIESQIRNHKKVFNVAYRKHLTKVKAKSRI